jgi:hypothetical protein
MYHGPVGNGNVEDGIIGYHWTGESVEWCLQNSGQVIQGRFTLLPNGLLVPVPERSDAVQYQSAQQLSYSLSCTSRHIITAAHGLLSSLPTHCAGQCVYRQLVSALYGTVLYRMVLFFALHCAAIVIRVSIFLPLNFR